MRKILIPILCLVALGLGRTAVPNLGWRNFEIVRHNINQVEMCVSNYGKFGQDENGNAGCWWPKGTGHNYIYGAGPWLGTITTTGDTLVTIGYGPHGGEAEYAPGATDWAISNPNAVIFIAPSNWPPDPSAFPDASLVPTATLSHQDSWCVYNDGDINYHIPGDTRPIGLEVYQTVYAWNLSTTENIIFVRYDLKNVSGGELTDCYFGICTDNDIGNESGDNANDRTSCILDRTYIIGSDTFHIDNLGYQWQDEMEGTWFPGTIGFDYLQSPYDLVTGEDKDDDGIPDQYEMDSAYFAQSVPQTQWDTDGDGTPDWRDPSQVPQLGMSAFKRVTIDLEPTKDNERYMTLAGYNFKTGIREPYDTVIPEPADQRFLQCSGPFTFADEQVITVVVGIVFADWYGIFATPDSALAEVDDMAQYIYDMNWLLPGPPPSPTLTCVPGDKQITLVWDSQAETTPDPYYAVVHYADPSSPVYDPYYLEYDFQGYRVWKSPTGKSGTWELLGSYDLCDGITFSDATFAETLNAVDAGLVHSFVDEDVRNGFNYFYAVTAFDYNLVRSTYDSVYVDTFIVLPGGETLWDYDTVVVSGSRPIHFESGQVEVSATPRRDPANLVPGSVAITSLSGNPAIAVNNAAAVITHALAMTADPMYLDFGPIQNAGGRPRYSAYLKDNAESVLDSIAMTMTAGSTIPHEFAVQHGISVSPIMSYPAMTAPIFDRVEVTSGTYSDTNLIPETSITPNWAYRGNPFKVEWYRKTGGRVNSVIVTDMITGDTIPYRPMSATADSTFDGWAFRSSSAASDTIMFGTPGTGVRYLYVCGGGFKLKKSGWLTPADTLLMNTISDGEVWTVYPVPTYPPAPFSARLQITPTPAQLRTDTTFALNVKVVPNPYIIGNEWQQSTMIRRMRFINLPGECTIRIFNLNGELVKTIMHRATIEPEKGEEVLGNAGGDEWWNLLSMNGQLVASGVYVFHVQSDVGEQVGKFVIVR